MLLSEAALRRLYTDRTEEMVEGIRISLVGVVCVSVAELELIFPERLLQHSVR